MYEKYWGDYWKIYLDRLEDKQTGQFVALKPGYTKFKNAEDRINFNHECFLKGEEKDSFKNHHKVKCIWSIVVDSEPKRILLEKLMLDWFGDKKDLGYWTSGSGEVREYNQSKVNRWLSKDKEDIQKWLNENIYTYSSSLQSS